MGELRDINPDEFTSLSEFDDAIEYVAEETARIEMQLLSAKGAAASYGEYADPDWYARANGALRFAKAKKQTLARKRADLAAHIKEERHKNKDVGRTQMFINLCRDVLPKEQYLQLWNRVDEMEKQNGQ